MNYNHVNKELFSFLDRSPNAFFAIKNMCDVLSKAGTLSGSRRRTTQDFR